MHAGYRWTPGDFEQVFPKLPRQDSNLKCLNQNQECCHYTTGDRRGRRYRGGVHRASD